jgi:hypothetical protein
MTTKERLEEMMIEKGYIVDLLWGVQGQWRKTIMDVMRWHAHLRKSPLDKITTQVGSWYTMTQCVRRGFTLKEDASPWILEAVANDRKQSRRTAPGKLKRS